jgi:effector-binding domain-containing protein
MKKWLLFGGVLLLTALAWYLFIKPYDYRVAFRVKAIPGTINQTIKSWDGELNSTRLVSQGSLRELRQELIFNDSIHEYLWEIEPLTDSTSQVYVFARDTRNSLANKLRIPFVDTDFEKRTRKTLLDFNDVLADHIRSFRVRIEGETSLPEAYCAYVTVKGHQFDKARGMMYNYPLLSSILAENNVALDGPPFLEVTAWNEEKDSIQYDFCYPIIKTDSLPQHPDLKYRPFPFRKAVKAIYNGNYITSDRAWYALLDHAEKTGRKVIKRPVEVFLNNPNMGSNELDWTTEIYMPIDE